MNRSLLCIGIALTGLGCATQGNVLYDFDDDGSLDADDCAPSDPLIHPGADDPYGDDVDQNCDGADGDANDLDNDGVPNDSDCEPDDAEVHSGADDSYGDGVDQNCDGSDGVDTDGDGFASIESGGDDCNDTDMSIHPGADDPDDAVDQDCDGFARTAEVDVQPNEPTTTDTLFALVTTETSVYDLRWFVDDQERPEYSGFLTIQSPQTHKGENWRAVVTPYNSNGQLGDPVEDAVLIVNSPPSATMILGLVPDPREGDVLSALASTTDPDGDAVTVSYLWFVNGVQDNVESVAELSDASFDKNDEIWATMTPHDGTDAGESVESNHVVVVNSAPSATSVAIDPSAGSEATVFTCLPSGWADPDPADSESYDYSWTVSGLPVSNNAFIDGTMFDRDQPLVCQATPNDGDDAGATVTSAAVVVSNSAPSIVSVLLDPSDPTETSTLTATPQGAADADPGDTVSFSYLWSVNGQSAGSSATISGTDFDKGDTIDVEVTPSDGTDAGVAVQSNTVTVLNTPPQITSATLSPNPAYTASTLTPVIDGWLDPDPADSPTYTYQWWLNTTTDAGQGATLGSSSFVKNDELMVEVTPIDGAASGAMVSSNSLVIANTVPTAPVVGLTPNSATVSDDLVCSLTSPSSDPDVDDNVDPALTYDFNWSRNGTAEGAWDLTGGSASSTSTVDSSATSVEESWSCEVRASDGQVVGPASSQSVTVQPPCNALTPGSCYSLEFDNDIVTVGSTPGSVLGGAPKWIGAWVYPIGGVGGAIMVIGRDSSGGSPPGGQRFQFGLHATGALYISVNQISDSTTTLAAPTEQWSYVFAYWDGSSYGAGMVNGGTVVTENLSLHSQQLSTGTMTVGSYLSKYGYHEKFFGGRISELQLRSSIPSTEDILDMAKGVITPASFGGLESYWAMNEGPPGSVSNNLGSSGSNLSIGTAEWNASCSQEDLDGDCVVAADDCNDNDSSAYPGAQSCPATSCLDLLGSGGTADGTYWIDPDGTGAFEAYCDMTTDGGGWTRVAGYDTTTGWSPGGAPNESGWADGIAAAALGAGQVTRSGLGQLRSQIGFQSIRFQCEISSVGRKVNLGSSAASVLDFFTGVSNSNPPTSGTVDVYSDDTSILGASPQNWGDSSGGIWGHPTVGPVGSISYHPFWIHSSAHFNMGAATGGSYRWECDTYGNPATNATATWFVYVR